MCVSRSLERDAAEVGDARAGVPRRVGQVEADVQPGVGARVHGLGEVWVDLFRLAHQVAVDERDGPEPTVSPKCHLSPDGSSEEPGVVGLGTGLELGFGVGVGDTRGVGVATGFEELDVVCHAPIFTGLAVGFDE